MAARGPALALQSRRLVADDDCKKVTVGPCQKRSFTPSTGYTKTSTCDYSTGKRLWKRTCHPGSKGDGNCTWSCTGAKTQDWRTDSSCVYVPPEDPEDPDDPDPPQTCDECGAWPDCEKYCADGRTCPNSSGNCPTCGGSKPCGTWPNCSDYICDATRTCSDCPVCEECTKDV